MKHSLILFTIFTTLILLFTGCQDPIIGSENSTPTDIALSAAAIAEDQPVGSTVCTLSVTDADTGDTHVFTLTTGFGDNASFTIDGTSLKTADELDYETKNSYSIKINVNDGTDNFAKELSITTSAEVIEFEEFKDPEDCAKMNQEEANKLMRSLI